MMQALFVSVALVAAAPATPQAAILAEMTDSAAGWNTGDMARFMALYADDAVYVSSKGLVRGKPAIAEHYRQSFAFGSNSRGRLSFSETSFRPIDPNHVLMWARWTLTGAAEKTETGMTTLLFERRPQGWRVISDHSS